MYLTNLIIIVGLLPFIAFYALKYLPLKRAAQVLGVMLAYGLTFTIMTTQGGYSFENNTIDLISIYLFFLSIFGWISWLIRYSNLGKWVSVLMILVAVTASFFIYNLAFGPSEACGQRRPENTYFFGENIKVTYTGFPYGLMDYGSRFIVYDTRNGFEKIIGLAGNPNQYYENIIKLTMLNGMERASVVYSDFQNKTGIDTLNIRKR